MTTATITRRQLSPLIERTLQVPGVGARAVKAAELVVTGAIRRLPDAVNGDDRWAVDGTEGGAYTVSIRGESCDCADARHGAPQYNGGPLCKHRLAAMMVLRLAGDNPVTPGDQIAPILAEAAAENARLRLYVTELYTGSVNSATGNLITGYRLNDGETVPVQIRVDGLTGTFWAAIEAAGWGRHSSMKTGYSGRVWEMRPVGVPVDWRPGQTATAAAGDDDLWEVTR